MFGNASSHGSCRVCFRGLGLPIDRVKESGVPGLLFLFYWHESGGLHCFVDRHEMDPLVPVCV